jgi:hypothetical protein
MGQTSTARQSPGDKSKYIPGVCNIGPAERAKRRQSGAIASLVTLVLLAILVAIAAPKGWRLLLILPASVAATGFLQSALHFCAGFGMKGIYNVVNSAGITDNVSLEEFRLKDRRKAQLIIGLSLAIGMVIAGLSLLF